MKGITSYLSFDGNCREAMTFYRDCLGGKLELQTVGESAMSEKMPERMKESILHATLTKKGFQLLGSDLVSNDGLMRGNAVSLMLRFSTKKEIHATYEKLSRGGKATYPLEINFWGALFGGLTDKYGVHWLLHYHQHK